jgi:hypothetical protein
MKRIAVFYHCRVAGGAHPKNSFAEACPAINQDHAIDVVNEQHAALRLSGLLDSTHSFYVGCNGTKEECEPARKMIAEDGEFICHGVNAAGELPTLRLLEEWVKTHPDWLVFYHHSKGVCWPGPTGEFRRNWRRCLTWALVYEWKRCIRDLESNKYDMVGGHWLSPQQFPGMEHLKKPIWGGNFFWATGSFLNELPPISKNTDWAHRWDAEHWVGEGRMPSVKDYCPHWPNPVDCAMNASKIKW